MLKIEFAHELRSKRFDVRERIDDEGNVFRAILPCVWIGKRLAKGAAKAGIGNGVAVRRMNAHISVAGPVLAQGPVIILRSQCTVGEDDDRKLPFCIGIIDFDWDVFIARGVMQCNMLDRKYPVRS